MSDPTQPPEVSAQVCCALGYADFGDRTPDDPLAVLADEVRRLQSALAAAERALANERGEKAKLRELLVKCFEHLGEEILRKPLNESAGDGSQALSREVAYWLDRLTPPSAPAGEKTLP